LEFGILNNYFKRDMRLLLALDHIKNAVADDPALTVLNEKMEETWKLQKIRQVEARGVESSVVYYCTQASETTLQR
jgi:hypothetical protein